VGENHPVQTSRSPRLSPYELPQKGQPSFTQCRHKRPVPKTGVRPIIVLPEGGPRLSHWPVLASKAGEWMEDAKRIAVAGYRQVLEDGPANAIRKARRNTVTMGRYGRIRRCTPDMMNEKGELGLERARMTTEQANALRAAGIAGGPVTVSGRGRTDAWGQCSNASPIPFNVTTTQEIPRIGHHCRELRT
jgi:hypothetical protein